jgi:hypothetical protein
MSDRLARWLVEIAMPPRDFRWMTAEEWDTSDRVWLMAHNADQKTGSKRKLNLFGAACCRRHWSVLQIAIRELLIEFEEALDQRGDPEQWSALCESLCWLADRAACRLNAAPTADRLHTAAAEAVCELVAYGGSRHRTGWIAQSFFAELDPTEVPHQAHLLRDVFGNPFRPVTFDPSWRTSTAMSLARQMYESREFSAMPILADALQDAGCEHPDVLTHCRDPKGVHVRGCWVVDLVLGKC